MLGHRLTTTRRVSARSFRRITLDRMKELGRSYPTVSKERLKELLAIHEEL